MLINECVMKYALELITPVVGLVSLPLSTTAGNAMRASHNLMLTKFNITHASWVE